MRDLRYVLSLNSTRGKRVLFVVVLGSVVGASALAQVPLQSRTVTPTQATTSDFIASLKKSQAEARHALASFATPPTEQDRRQLRQLGIRVLEPFSDRVYLVRVEKRVELQALLANKPTVQLIQLQPVDKVEPRIWRGDLSGFVVNPRDSAPTNFVLNPDDTLNLAVRFFPGVSIGTAQSILKRYGTSFQMQSDQTWTVTLPKAALPRLAAEDTVQWIDAGPPPSLPDNNLARAAIRVDPIQNFNAATGQLQGLGGTGVDIGIFDSGIDQTHNDFGTRVIFAAAGSDAHGTHVAGTAAGGGNLSNQNDSWGVANAGTPFQWRGMAPQANLIDVPNVPNGGNVGSNFAYITNQGMDLSNHSYSFSFDGAYDLSNRTRDQMIRGDATSGGNPVPARLHVYSAGNHGVWPQRGGNQNGYFSLTKQIKNGLIVGNWNVTANQISQNSSLGPAHDGRIKPDVVAPGTTLTSTGYCANNRTIQCAGMRLESRC